MDNGAFDRAEHGDVLELVEPDLRGGFSSALEDAGRNWRELSEAVGRLEDEERDACVWLIEGMPHLDRLEMSAETLVEHVEYAFVTLTDMPYVVPEDMFRPYILTYRIEEEPVEPWRRQLYERFGPLARQQADVRQAARSINREIADLVSEREREFFGPRQSPLLTLRSKRGTETDISVLACAAMKAVGIPSRQTGIAALGAEDGGTSWIEIFDGDEWAPLYPLEPDAFGDTSYLERENWNNVSVVETRTAFERSLVTESYTETGTVELSFVEDGRPAAGFEHFSISVLNKGALVPLDALEAVADEEGLFEATLGDGEYVVEAGVRDAGGNAFVMIRPLVIPPGVSRSLAFDVSPDWRDRDPSDETIKRYELSMTAWVAFDLESEPSVRMLPLIVSAFDRLNGMVEVKYLCMSPDPDAVRKARLVIGESGPIVALPDPEDWYYVTEGGDTHPVGPRGAELPVVRLLSFSRREVLLHNEGYDLNIERAIVGAANGFIREIEGR